MRGVACSAARQPSNEQCPRVRPASHASRLALLRLCSVDAPRLALLACGEPCRVTPGATCLRHDCAGMALANGRSGVPRRLARQKLLPAISVQWQPSLSSGPKAPSSTSPSTRWRGSVLARDGSLVSRAWAHGSLGRDLPCVIEIHFAGLRVPVHVGAFARAADLHFYMNRDSVYRAFGLCVVSPRALQGHVDGCIRREHTGPCRLRWLLLRPIPGHGRPHR